MLLKDGTAHDHPKIVQAAAAIQGAVGKRDPADIKIDIYSTGLSVIFLATLNASQYRAEIDLLLASLRLRQKPHGGWGYPERETGDTSMTQYGVLSMWEAAQTGCTVPRESVEAVTLWLLKTQDPTGGFGYQGTVSTTFAPVKQSEVRHSMAAAGLGSVYICRPAGLCAAAREARRRSAAGAQGSQAQATGGGRGREAEDAGRSPRAPRGAAARQRLDGEELRHQSQDVDVLLPVCLGTLPQLPRIGRRQTREGPAVVQRRRRYLIRIQEADGSWTGQGKATADTAFATLFLLRSTKKSIERSRAFGEGTLLVGRGLPPYTDQVAVRHGRVVSVPRLTTAKEVRAALAGPPGADYDQAVAALAELPPQEAETLAAQDAAWLRRLSVDRAPQVRIAAVQVLGNARNLDGVPTLIAALDDPDWAVVRAAHDALRRIAPAVRVRLAATTGRRPPPRGRRRLEEMVLGRAPAGGVHEVKGTGFRVQGSGPLSAAARSAAGGDGSGNRLGCGGSGRGGSDSTRPPFGR